MPKGPATNRAPVLASLTDGLTTGPSSAPIAARMAERARRRAAEARDEMAAEGRPTGAPARPGAAPTSSTRTDPAGVQPVRRDLDAAAADQTPDARPDERAPGDTAPELRAVEDTVSHDRPSRRAASAPVGTDTPEHPAEADVPDYGDDVPDHDVSPDDAPPDPDAVARARAAGRAATAPTPRTAAAETDADALERPAVRTGPTRDAHPVSPAPPTPAATTPAAHAPAAGRGAHAEPGTAHRAQGLRTAGPEPRGGPATGTASVAGAIRPPVSGRATVPAAPPHPEPDDPPTAVQPLRRVEPRRGAARAGYDHPAVQLVRTGVPVHIAARAVGPDPWSAVARAVAGLPYPPGLPSRAGEVLAIVGDIEAALIIAGQVAALTAGIDPSATLVAGPIAGTGLRRSHRISGPEEAIRRAAELHSSAGPRIVVVEATAGSPLTRTASVTSSVDASPHATIAALAPTQVWACVDATRKNADTARFLDALDRVDALAVYGADATVEPGSVLHFGLPVVMLDGRPATARRWTTLLCERLAGGPLPNEGDGPITSVMPLELPAGRRGAHAASVDEPRRPTTHRAPDVEFTDYLPTDHGAAVFAMPRPAEVEPNGHGHRPANGGVRHNGHTVRTWWPEDDEPDGH
ncbi:hypothetical protein [Cryptosporangium minutisporangium]|uniref:hypothetical protein n=1 Tax=Cryptosporangium minutisporangium TaxID=113569 RepID=UPI0035ED38DD